MMETKDIILELRTKKGLSQEELAEKIFVTRQAVSRWENGETIPNTETLKLLSKEFDRESARRSWMHDEKSESEKAHHSQYSVCVHCTSGDKARTGRKACTGL